MRILSALFALLVGPRAFAAPTLTTCYTDVEILGQLEDLDKTVRKLSGIFALHGPVNRQEAGGRVSERLLVSVTGRDSTEVREKTEADFVKRIIAMAAKPAVVAVGTEFLGCKSDKLE